jgi:hypothetical protein
MARAVGRTVVIRSRWSQALGVAMVVLGLVGAVTTTFEGFDSLRTYGAPMLLFAMLGWAAFWQPHVEVSDGGVRVANTWRTVEVPWPAITEIEGRYGLRLQTPYGAVTAWAAPAPSGRSRVRSGSSEAAQIVNARLEELRAAGYLDDPTLERASLTAAWDVSLIAAAGLLLLASVALPLLP